MKERNQDLINALDKASFINQSDKNEISELLSKLANPKLKYFVQPVETSAKEIPMVRSKQEVIAKQLPKAKDEFDFKLVQDLFKASEDFFRYNEMFEQNVAFIMFVIVVFSTIVTPIAIAFI